MWTYYKQPLDAWSVSISEVVRLDDEGLALNGKCSYRPGQGRVSRPSITPPLCMPITPMVPQSVEARAVLEQKWQVDLQLHPFVLLLPQPIIDLVLIGRWSRLLVCWNWGRSFWGNDFVRPFPIPAGLALSRLQQQSGQRRDVSHGANAQFTLDAARLVRGYVTSTWTANSAKSGASSLEDADTERELQLGRAVTALSNYISHLETTCAGIEARKKKPKLDPSRMVHAILALKFVRNRQDVHVRTLVDQLFKALLPSPLEAALAPLANNLPSTSVASKALLPLDMALSATRGDLDRQHGGPVFLFCDASVQAKVDWLLSMYDVIPTQHVRDAFESVHALCRGELKFRQQLALASHDGLANLETVEAMINLRSQAGHQLTQYIRRHMRVPIAVTSHTTLESKARALGQGTWVDHPSIEMTEARWRFRLLQLLLLLLYCTNRGERWRAGGQIPSESEVKWGKNEHEGGRPHKL